MHVGEHGDDVTRHAAPVGEGSAAGARVCEREVQRAEVMGNHWGCRGGGGLGVHHVYKGLGGRDGHRYARRCA